MRDGQVSSLLFLCFIFIKACLADGDLMSENVRARLGQSASLSCRVTGEVHVVLSEWTRCKDLSSIALFYPETSAEHSSHVNESYTGHVSITEYHTLTIQQVRDGDFGEYCCKVATFPKGSLVGKVHLLQEGKEVDQPIRPPEGLSVMTIVYITCGVVGFVILTGIITVLLCSKRRRKIRNPVHVIVTASLSPKQPSLLQKDPHTLSHTPSHTPSHTQRRDDEGDDDMYLNVFNLTP